MVDVLIRGDVAKFGLYWMRAFIKDKRVVICHHFYY